MRELRPSLERAIQAMFESRDYRPLRRSEIARSLGLKPERRRELREALRAMETRGEAIRKRRNRYAPPDRSAAFEGVLSVHPRGFAFVADADDPSREAYVPADGLAGALHGDRVRVAVAADPDRAGAPRWRGRVTEVLDRSTLPLVGRLHRGPHALAVIPDDPRFPTNIRIDPASAPPGGRLVHGHQVVVELAPWTPGAQMPTGRVVEDLGDPADPATAMTGLLRRHGLTEVFPEPAMRQARTPRPSPTAADMTARRDLRDRLVFTIDPEDAKDYDDAVSLQPLPDGGWQLGVHIADVAHFVPPGSAIDQEARHRGTSVYLVDRTVTMLPGHLTREVCSLLADADRLTRTVQVRLAPDGEVAGAEIFPSTIRSRACLAYADVQRFFDTDDPGAIPVDVADTLRAMRGLARTLRTRRMRGGALDLQTSEVRCRLDAAGHVAAIEPRTETEAYQLIEECMLVANRAVAGHLGAAGSPCLYRIHEAPDESQWEEMERDLAVLGFDLARRNRAALNRLVRETAATPLGYPVTLAILRNLKRAVYAPHHRPHFGLGFADYTHFTSPIRRYPDLVIHRLLDASARGAPPPYRQEDLKELGLHCSRREREADEAERESVEIKRIDYYAGRLAEGDTGPWPGVIVSVLPRGLLVELPATLQRGLVPFAALPGGHLRASADRTRVVGGRGSRDWKVGAPIEVRLTRVDAARRWIDFAPAGPESPVSASGRSSAPSRRRARRREPPSKGRRG